MLTSKSKTRVAAIVKTRFDQEFNRLVGEGLAEMGEFADWKINSEGRSEAVCDFSNGVTFTITKEDGVVVSPVSSAARKARLEQAKAKYQQRLDCLVKELLKKLVDSGEFAEIINSLKSRYNEFGVLNYIMNETREETRKTAVQVSVRISTLQATNLN